MSLVPRLAGLVALTSHDYPDHLAAVLFCQGCPWSCGYCHNPHLIPARGNVTHDWLDIMRFLESRRGLLDGVVFSGGEPLYQNGLEAAASTIRDMGFAVGLHTGGAYPERLSRLLPLLDWIGMDVKAEFSDYDRVTGASGSGERASRALGYLLDSGIDYEIRTTVHPLVFSRDSLQRLAKDLAVRGVRRYVLQEFRPMGCITESYRDASARQLLAPDLCRYISTLFASFEVRAGV